MKRFVRVSSAELLYLSKCASPKNDHPIDQRRLVQRSISQRFGSRESSVPYRDSGLLFNLFRVLVGSGKNPQHNDSSAPPSQGVE
jgi:hypothetical protein